jgi:hypothetical protein
MNFANSLLFAFALSLSLFASFAFNLVNEWPRIFFVPFQCTAVRSSWARLQLAK